VTDPVFLADLPDPLPECGSPVLVDGAEGRHAATVRRIRPGEQVVVSDGHGRGVRGPVVEVGKDSITVRADRIETADEPAIRITVAQALAKGDRSDLACQIITELGVVKIVPWQAARSIVRWRADRAAKSHAKWLSTVREAAKQSRRLRVPEVTEAISTRQLATMISDHDLTLVLHEEAPARFADLGLPRAGDVLIVVGPEGGITGGELDTFTAAGGCPVSISEGVLRTSTAAAVAISGILLR
jgi:16S rRNA (uracil1498-N3)-methyltransferase